ncbi:MAG: hypothetical protein DWQ08_15580 [Proteobacteria bacterium]|nr:MAG: hypothetical protein DWQ08_15580 [Pseudomonadota bacterium]
MVHKSDLNGGAVSRATPAQALAAAEAMLPVARSFLVESMIDDGVAELIVGVGLDPQFGHFVTIGAGGVITELLGDSVTLLPPFDVLEITRALQRLRVHRLLSGWRGKPAGDIEAVADVVMRIAALAAALGDTLLELDINPLIVRPAGRGAVAADTLITLEEE